MKGLIASVLFAILFVGLVLADSPRAASKDQAVIDAVKQVGDDMGKAMARGEAIDGSIMIAACFVLRSI